MGTSRSDLASSRWAAVARSEALRTAPLGDPWRTLGSGSAEGRVARTPKAGWARRRRDGPPELRAVMPGKVLAVLVALGDTVVAGQGVVVIEAMKMENELGAPRAGVVRKLAVKPGQAVESGELLALVE